MRVQSCSLILLPKYHNKGQRKLWGTDGMLDSLSAFRLGQHGQAASIPTAENRLPYPICPDGEDPITRANAPSIRTSVYVGTGPYKIKQNKQIKQFNAFITPPFASLVNVIRFAVMHGLKLVKSGSAQVAISTTGR